MLGDVTVCLKKRYFVTVFCAAITFLFKTSIFLRRAWTQIKTDYNSENLSPEVIKLFLCSIQLSRENLQPRTLYTKLYLKDPVLLQLKKSLAK